MAGWFIGRGTNELVRQLSPENLVKFCQRFHTNVVIEISVVGEDAIVDRTTTDLVLNYDPPVLSLESQEAGEKPDPRFAKIPLIQFQEVPLPIAIEGLARQAELNFTLDRTLDISRSDIPQPVVTFRWQNISATQALIALLDIYDLEWREDSKTGVALVRRKRTGGRPFAFVGADLQEKIQALVRKSILRAEGEYSKERCLSGSQGFELTLNSPPQTKPARVVLRTAKTLNARDVTEFFPTNVVLSEVEAAGLRVEGDDNRFQVLLSAPPFTPKEYLAWSDQFIPDFDTMREALKRPKAQMEGDYRHPRDVPIPNYLTFRRVVETLTQRAQCFLLLNQPDKALNELTLIYQLSRASESHPITLVAAMTDAAIFGHYVEVINEGLRRRAWRNSQLTAIQQQLEQTDLLPILAEALRVDRASTLRIVEDARTEIGSRDEGGVVGLIKDLSWLPRGWFDQNYSLMTKLQQTVIESLDTTNRIVVPAKTREFCDGLDKLGKHPYEFVGAIVVPNFSKAVQTAAFNQSELDRAKVACALERYQLSAGQYPDTIEALAPGFLNTVPHDIIGGQPLKYRRVHSGYVLYSVGWNELDEQGTARLNADGSVDKIQGDWVWRSSDRSDDRRLTAN